MEHHNTLVHPIFVGIVWGGGGGGGGNSLYPVATSGVGGIKIHKVTDFACSNLAFEKTFIISSGNSSRITLTLFQNKYLRTAVVQPHISITAF